MARKFADMLDAAAQARIEEAVRSAELASTGEIVPVIVERSSDYPEARLRGALLGAGIAILIAVAVEPGSVDLVHVLWAQALGMTAGYLISAVPPVLRWLVGQSTLARISQERAMRAFLEQGLAHTSGRTGVLVFTSWLERKVVILGDEAIDQKMGSNEWQRAVSALVAGLSRGALADGLCDAIAIVGQKLSEHFPRGAHDVDELPNRPTIEER